MQEELVGHPENLIVGKKYTVLVTQGQRMKRIAGRFLRLESRFDYVGKARPKHATLFIALERRMGVELVPWADSFDWRLVKCQK